jgi:hypothetical protein
LPRNTLDYILDYHVNDDNTITLDVTLNAIANPANTAAYKAELEEYKQDAIDYMKSVGVDFDKTKIIYTPDPAKL